MMCALCAKKALRYRIFMVSFAMPLILRGFGCQIQGNIKACHQSRTMLLMALTHQRSIIEPIAH